MSDEFDVDYFNRCGLDIPVSRKPNGAQGLRADSIRIDDFEVEMVDETPVREPVVLTAIGITEEEMNRREEESELFYTERSVPRNDSWQRGGTLHISGPTENPYNQYVRLLDEMGRTGRTERMESLREFSNLQLPRTHYHRKTRNG